MRPSAGCTLTRSGAGETLSEAASGRIMKKRVSPLSAAKCSRSMLSGCTSFCQKRKAPQLPLRRICSISHSMSAVRSARNHSTAAGGKPKAAKATVYGACGGFNITKRHSAACCSVGTSSPTAGLFGQPERQATSRQVVNKMSTP